METLSRITGVRGRVEELPAEAFLEKDPIGFKASVLETGLFVTDFEFTGSDKQILMLEEGSSIRLASLDQNIPGSSEHYIMIVMLIY